MRSSFDALKYATRRLYKTPGFTVLCVLTIALVVGVNTAVFSIVDALLLRPLPYRDSQRLVNLWETIRHDGRGGISFPNFLDLQQESQAFKELAAWSSIEADVAGDGHADRLRGENVTPSYFRTLGINPAKGRDFTPQDDKDHPVVIISHALWQSRFGSDPNVLGKTLKLGGSLFTVVGVMPGGFRGYSGTAQFWAPVSTYDLIFPNWRALILCTNETFIGFER